MLALNLEKIKGERNLSLPNPKFTNVEKIKGDRNSPLPKPKFTNVGAQGLYPENITRSLLILKEREFYSV
jgi:hypothetical protein